MNNSPSKKKKAPHTAGELAKLKVIRADAISKMSLDSSENPKKFVARMANGLHTAMKDCAVSHGRSFNSEIVHAVYNSLACSNRSELLRTILMSYAGDRASEALTLFEPIEYDASECFQKMVIRLSDGMSAAMEAEAALSMISQQKVIQKAFYWWVNLNREMAALLAVCEGPDINPVPAQSIGHQVMLNDQGKAIHNAGMGSGW